MLPVEPTDDLANPAFKDATSCRKWLSQLQLTNLNLAHATLRTQLDELNRHPMRGKDRLQTLEALRETVANVQADYAKKLFGKKLPLADEEFTLLIALSNLWGGMLNGYLRCLQSVDVGDSSIASEAALVSHHCLAYGGLQLGEFLRAGCEPDGKSWQRFHAIYAYVEEHGLQQQHITDKFRHSGHAVTCRALYAKTLLLHRARLLGLTRSHWQIVDRWLEEWGDSFTVEPRCSMSAQDAPPLAVDLAGSRGLIPVARAVSSNTMRFLAMVPLSKLIRVKTILLQQGQSPEQLELGSELNSKDCVDLLSRLHACWCEQRAESLIDEPRSNVPVAQVCSNLENIYAHIAGKPFKQPSAGAADKEAQKQIETFGRVLDETDRHNLAQLGFLAEDWLVEEDGVLQGRLLRKTAAGARLGVNQILCVHRADAAAYKTGVCTLASVSRSGQLYVGVRYLPGVPQGVLLRGGPSGNLRSGAAAALLLPEISNLRIPASLIIPRDWFQTGRPLDLTLADGSKQGVTLGFSVEKGADFERVSLTLKR